MATIASDIIKAADFGVTVCHDLGDDMAVIQYGNGRLAIADVADLEEFGEIMQIGNPVKFASSDRSANIAAMIAKYHA